MKEEARTIHSGSDGQKNNMESPGILRDLAAMEAHIRKLKNKEIHVPAYTDKWTLNPGLRLFSNNWTGLARFFDPAAGTASPLEGKELVLVWPDPVSGDLQVRPASAQDLLVLKLAMENLDSQAVAARGNTQTAGINGAVLEALNRGVILGPKPGIERSGIQNTQTRIFTPYMSSRVFALQWHITQACDLHCRHCYDRTPCPNLPLIKEIAVLDNLFDFCSVNNLFGQVTFTGGNPLLHPHFHSLYKEASDRGFFIGILGNPTDRQILASLTAIQKPAFFQVSLEGLEHHNDYIRGTGHFKRVMSFLDLLKQEDIYSQVMLTLTRANMDQVIPLGNALKNRTDRFTFNRLSLSGEGAGLSMAEPDRFSQFLGQYLDASVSNPVMDIKDNLFNILLEEGNSPLFGGCTGFGCGAAFNFLSLLPTGEVHACRKFPSPLGNITRQSLDEIYHSPMAENYRRGPELCSSCRLNPVCRGCLAAAFSTGQDALTVKDPYCFLDLRSGPDLKNGSLRR